MTSLPHLLESVASHHHGCISSHHLRSHGFTPDQIRWHVKQGRLLPVFKGVYRVAGAPLTDRLVLEAACLVNGRDSVVSHRSAARFWELDLRDERDNATLEITALRDCSARTPGVTVHRPLYLDPHHTCERNGLMTTLPGRTLVDIGSVVTPAQVGSAVEQALIRRLVSVSLLRHLCAKLDVPLRPGVRVVREYLDRRGLDGKAPDSEVEVRFARICREAGIEPGVFQYVVVVDGRRYRIDFAFPELLLAIEVEGWSAHIEYEQWTGDRVRAGMLGLSGWRIVPFPYRTIVDDPDYVVRHLADHIATRRAEMAELDRLHHLAGLADVAGLG